MDGDIYIIKYNQIQMDLPKPLLVLILIPIFEIIIYPLLVKIGIRRPLQKMTIAIILAAIAFVTVAIVVMRINKMRFVQRKTTSLRTVSSMDYHAINVIMSRTANGRNRLR